jgi:predicted metal-dependent hydrolase
VAELGSVRFGSTTIPFAIIRSRRRKKTIEITLDPADGVLVSAPVNVPSDDVVRVVQRRAGWIVRKGTEAMLHPRPKQFVSGESLPYLGRQVRMFVDPSEAQRASVHFDHWTFRIVVPKHLSGDVRRKAALSAVTGWYKRRAQERLTARARVWSEKLRMAPTRVLTRDQRQRWGSCAPDGTIRFNWRVVMAEPSLIDYVVLHELLHLKVRNHGHEFWEKVAAFMPDYKVRRARLREFGPTLVI